MKILLIAPDSKFPNLAMMKISAYHKAKGDRVGWEIDSPDKIYASILFPKNKHLVKSWKALFFGTPIEVGGPGFDPSIKLPPEIESMPPDHSIYPDSKYSFGRVTSGCIRKCSFCIVHILEPNGIRFIQHPKDIWKKGTILRLLDDNILALPEAFWTVHGFCIENNVTTRFEYLDARLVTPEIAKGLKEIKHESNRLIFSFDLTAIEPAVRRTFAYLSEAGIKPQNTLWLLYMHDEDAIPDTKYRWEVIRSLGGNPFVMGNNDFRTPRMKRIIRRAARPAIWRHLPSEEVFK